MDQGKYKESSDKCLEKEGNYMNRRIISYNISESFNLVRWCLVAIAFAFVAIVSVAKYVNLSDATSITFSSLETTYLILNDTISVVYIYLPLYLFVICGLMFDDNFGSLDIIKCGSRTKWLAGKYITLLFYTLMFFILLFGMNFLISDQVFPYSAKWSSDFMNVQVLLGQEVRNFAYGPMQTIGLSLLSVFFLYLFAGTVSIVFSVLTNKEALALLFSLVIGILVSISFVMGFEMMAQKNIGAFMLQNSLLMIGTVITLLITSRVVNHKDFSIQKKH